MALSADGYVADRDGGVDFLDPFHTDEAVADYGAFIKTIDTVVMGRMTYDQIVGFGVPWPYQGKRAIVVTSRAVPGDKAAGAPEFWSGGIVALAQTPRDGTHGDTWIVGGPRLQAAFLKGAHLDRLDLFLMPVLLGGGVRLFEAETAGPPLHLSEATTLPKGIVKLVYSLAPQRPDATT